MKQLSKDEMKKVMGGVQATICGYWPAQDYDMVLAECTGSVEGCTDACNNWCATEPGCVNGTCHCM